MRAWSRAERSPVTPSASSHHGYLHEGHLASWTARANLPTASSSASSSTHSNSDCTRSRTLSRDLPRDRKLRRRARRLPVCAGRRRHVSGEPLARVVPLRSQTHSKGWRGRGISPACSPCRQAVSPRRAGRRVFGRKIFSRRCSSNGWAGPRLRRHLDIAPTVRELDGLALSSRNTYLNPDERRSALVLSRALRTLEQTWRAGKRIHEGATRRAGSDACPV